MMAMTRVDYAVLWQAQISEKPARFKTEIVVLE